MIWLAALIALALPGQAPASAPAPPDSGTSARQLIFLAEHRPVFARVAVTCQGRPFDSSWPDSMRAIHASLDRDGNGTLTASEADPKAIAALVRLATGITPAIAEVDVHPKDGTVSIDELTEALAPHLGPFQLRVGRQTISRTDALFDQLDRDKDGELTQSELATIAGSLRPLDLDDNEMISADELDPLTAPTLAARSDDSTARPARSTTQPPVIELVPLESSLRPARLLLKRYDQGTGETPGRPDGKLSPSEFAIDPSRFAAADQSGDDALSLDELRSFLTHPPIDITINVAFPANPSEHPTLRVPTSDRSPGGTQVKVLGDRDAEFAVGQVRVDIRVEDNEDAAARDAMRQVDQRFKAADTNKDGYLDGKELAALNAPQSPFANLTDAIDRDHDGKIYLKELSAFVDRQQQAARARLLVTADDRGRAIFGILDGDRDRRLGAREVMRTVDRVMSWDRNADARVAPDEIPHHFQVKIARGRLSGLTSNDSGADLERTAAARAGGPNVGAGWFPKMDRNHDGDVSRREFLGTRDDFERLDRDKDGLIDADEAAAAAPRTPESNLTPSAAPKSTTRP